MSFEPITINTQDEYDNFVKDRIDRAKKSVEAKYKDFEDYKSKAEKYDADIKKKDDKIAAGASRISELETKVRNYETASVKARIADEVGLPAGMADRLRGETEEDLKKDAESLAAVMKKNGGVAPMANLDDDKPDDDTERTSYRKIIKNLRKNGGN